MACSAAAFRAINLLSPATTLRCSSTTCTGELALITCELTSTILINDRSTVMFLRFCFADPIAYSNIWFNVKFIHVNHKQPSKIQYIRVTVSGLGYIYLFKNNSMEMISNSNWKCKICCFILERNLKTVTEEIMKFVWRNLWRVPKIKSYYDLYINNCLTESLIDVAIDGEISAEGVCVRCLECVVLSRFHFELLTTRYLIGKN